MYAIIGGGIGGLTLGLALEKLGVDYVIYERATAFKEIGAGIWLPPNALQVFKWLDSLLLKELEENGNSIDRITLADLRLKPISDTDQNPVKNLFGFSTVAIHRGKLQSILVRQIPEDKIITGKDFQKFEVKKDKSISVFFEDGTRINSEFVIGVDGINSKIRSQIFPRNKLRYSGQTCWRGVADYTLESDFNHWGIEMWGDQLRFGISRLSNDKVYWFAVALDSANLKDNPALLKEKLGNMFANFHPVVVDLITNTEIEKIIRTDLNDLEPLDKWYYNNICLMGDAAHAMTPDLGQGGAQAIEDAYYLANLIKNEDTSPQVFEKFYANRNKKVNQLVRQSRSTGLIANLKYGKGIRNMLLRSIPSKMLLKQMLKTYQIERSQYT